MEILILSGILSSAIFLGSFALGYFLGTKQTKKDEKAYVVKNNEDMKQLEELAKWLNYNGGVR